jgi:Prenyltransferase and squalene oxidase repeat
MLAFVILGGAIGAAALAGAAAPRHGKSIDAIVAFLESHRLESGGYADPGGRPSQGISAWVTLAVAAAGVNPLDQVRFVDGVACGHSAEEYLNAHFAEGLHEEAAWPEIGTTAFERELLVVDTSGTDPHDFAGYDLVDQIISRQLPDGGIPYVPGGEAQVNDTAFGILALAPVKEAAAEAAVAAAAGWLSGAADPDGGFNWQGPGQPSESDLSGAAIEALVAAGRSGSDAEAAALAFLHTAQRPDGGFAEYPGTEAESNVASTAWATQGIWAAGEDPEAWRTGSGLATEEPLDYMESLQQPDGHIRWRASSDLNGIWMTAYALPAFTGQVMPYPLVPRSGAGGERLASCGEVAGTPEAPVGGAQAEATGSPGSGPGASAAGEGVAAGGGGNGAPDFSRPKPGSKGKTPGGARIVHRRRGEKATDHSRNRRGSNLHQAQGTETAEPRAGEGDQEAEAVSGGAGTAQEVPDAGEAAAARGEGDDSPDPASRSSDDDVGGRGGSHRGDGSGHGGAATDRARRSPTTTGREVSGVVIGSPGGADGKRAFGAPGLRSTSASGDGDEPWLPLAIGAAALALLALGARRELRRAGARGLAPAIGGGRGRRA